MSEQRWCVCAGGGFDSVGRSIGYGNGFTSSTWRLYAVASTQDAAIEILRELKAGKLLSEARIPGNGRIYPDLEVKPYDPLDFLSFQARNQFDGDLEGLREWLAEKAEENRETLR